MEIKYQKSLPHQQKAVDAIVSVFEDVHIEKPKQLFENPTINIEDNQISENIKKIISTSNCRDVLLHVSTPTKSRIAKYLTLDIKMETGTGKTYVYTNAIYEMHKRYGINKFVVAVPSLAIKEGAKSFLGDPDVKRHFSNTCGYNAEIDLCVLNAKQLKNGKRYFPSEVREFATGSCQTTNKIYVMLVNMGLLSTDKRKMLNRDDYDQTIQGFYRPFDAIKATRPFVIIDEPHRFSRDQKAFKVIEEQIEPQCVIRFGATFPKITNGKGNEKTTRKDYENLLYDLNACQAFNLNLVKGVAKEHFESPSKKDELIKILSINDKQSVVFEHVTAGKKKSHTLYADDSLASISPDMEGMKITKIGKDFVDFSNGQTKQKGEEFDVNIFATSYQEAMMRLALERHFETERANFNRSQHIKTLALFFIDDIASFRGDEQGNGAWLRDTFEELLKNQLNNEIGNTNSTEYKSFLQASLDNIRECSAGYFAKDNNDSDDEIAKEVDDILRNKKQLLSFKNQDGTWNTRRFLFSKWTLKEGWDNPNVFTITKLRSSGSDNSKIQEVGRGLRLPVDENGNRISNEEFLLNYIVDFREKDFADRLVAEINSDDTSVSTLIISDEDLDRVAIMRDTTSDDLFDELKSKRYIDRKQSINPETITDFYNEYPEFNNNDSVNKNKVIDRNKNRKNTVKIRSAKFEELKELWHRINQKYVIFFENNLNNLIDNDFHLKDGVFTSITIKSEREKIDVSNSEANVLREAGAEYDIQGKSIPYNEFLKQINKATSLPIKLINNKVKEYFKTHCYTDSLINESSAASFISQFDDWKIENLKGKLNYRKTDYNSKETSLTDVDGNIKDEVVQGLIGTMFTSGKPSDKYLYDGIAFDSPIEKNNILTDIEDVVVFGKIPKYSIAIPTILGNYSPDFMYLIKKKDGSKELNVVIESKNYDKKSDYRGVEKSKIECAKIFFEQLQLDGYDVKYHEQTNGDSITKIIKELVNGIL